MILGDGGIPTADPLQDGVLIGTRKQHYIGLDRNNTVQLQAKFNQHSAPAIQDVQIIFNRDGQGNWRCSIDSTAAAYWKEKYRPDNCL